ncbi:MAG: DUF4363 family protein [Peptococcaceae bacterium]
MKVISITLMITIMILIFAFYAVNILAKTSLDMTEVLKEIEAAVMKGEWNQAAQKLTDLEDKWEEYHLIWDMLIEHGEIDNIDISISHINSYIRRQDLTESYAEIKALYKYLEHIPEIEKLTLENIF